MRSLRSSLATMSSRTPSSTLPRPSFHCRARASNCAMSSGCVVGRISTTICAALATARRPRAYLRARTTGRGGQRAGEVGDSCVEPGNGDEALLRERGTAAAASSHITAARARGLATADGNWRAVAATMEHPRRAPWVDTTEGAGSWSQEQAWRRVRRRLRCAKVDGAGGGAEIAASFSHREVRLHLEVEHAGRQIRGEPAHRDVVTPAPPGCSDCAPP